MRVVSILPEPDGYHYFLSANDFAKSCTFFHIGRSGELYIYQMRDNALVFDAVYRDWVEVRAADLSERS